MYKTPNCYDAEPVRQWITRFISNKLKTTSLVTNSKHENIVLTPTQTHKHIEAKETIAIHAAMFAISKWLQEIAHNMQQCGARSLLKMQ